MARALDMMWSSILSMWAMLRDWLTQLAEDPSRWTGPFLGLIIALLALLLFLLLRPRPKEPRKSPARPDLMLSHGEVRALENSSITELRMHVSNLGETPVQLVEVALRTELMVAPLTVDLPALIAPNRTAEVAVEIEEITGDEGELDLYLLVPGSRRQAYRLRARIFWEPWNGRYKLDPLDQKLERVRRLASAGLRQRRREEWRQRQLELSEGRPVLTEVPSAVGTADDAEVVREREARSRLDFPSDF